ncbi:uncharacterized protein [Parasteatoda tepidariorum]|nr:uncharacterized protein LOC107456058 [Parasteatoda tepidariorum]
MLLSALLLIAWVVETTSTELHQQIPTKDLPLLNAKNISSRNPLIFSSLQESMIMAPNRSRYFSTVTGFRKTSKNIRSPANPGTNNGNPKVLFVGGIINPPSGFRSYLDGEDISNTTNMNNPSQNNGSQGNVIAHLAYSRDFEDQHMKQAEKEGRKSKLRNDDEDYHYGTSLREKVNAFSLNDSSSHLLNTETRELQMYHKTSERNATETKTVQLLESVAYFNISVEEEKSSPNKSFNSKVTANVHVRNSSDIQNKFLNLNFNGENKQAKKDVHSLERKNKFEKNSMPGNGKINETTKYVDDVASDNIKHSTAFTKSFESHGSTYTPAYENNLLVTANNDFRENASIISNMQQDGAFESVTKITEQPSSEGHYSNNKFHNEWNEIHKSDIFLKNNPPTSLFSSSITTPDSHMNDPPFRGPNVPLDSDIFVREKDKKIDFRNSVKETPYFPTSSIEKGWNDIDSLGRITWDYQCYITGSMFSVIALYLFISLLRVKTFIPLLRTCYYVTINSIIFLTCILRAFYLFYDPYGFFHKLPVVVSQVLLKITVPCLTSAFCFLVLSLLSFTKTQLFSPNLQTPSVLAVVVVFVISLSITLETAIHVFQISNIFLLLCYSIAISFGGFSSISYFFVFNRLHHRALRKQGEMIRVTFTKMHIDGARLPKKLPRPTLGLAVKLVLMVAIFQIILCSLVPYTVLFLQGLLPKVTTPTPWLWWSYQLSCRILELMICATISFIATQPLKHFEVDNNAFHNILMCFPCNSFGNCSQSAEIIDFEAHSDNYANPQGIRNPRLNLIRNTRRLQTNSLPTFRTPLTAVDSSMPMRTLPCSGRHTNHSSALSLLSYYRSKRALNMSKTEDLDDLERTLCSQSVSSSDGRSLFRPTSMLYKDNGFIRFRRETDPQQPMEMSDDDDHIQEDIDTSVEDADSTKANVGSSFHSLLESDIVQNTLSPFFQIDYKRRFRKMSRISIETTDYSADISSDQLSNIVNLRNGLSTSALDFHTKKYGSTCSSESAANSFDVTFFLNSNSSPQTSPISTALNIISAYRSETEDDKTSSVEGHEEMLRSVSPILKQASFGRLSLNLNLHASTHTNHSNGHVNVACGTEDITPDSAVYLDLPRESPKLSPNIFETHFPLQPQNSPEDTFMKSTDDLFPLTGSPYCSPTSQSLGEIRTSSSYVIPQFRKNSRGLLCKLRGSTFSLNTAIYGYEPLEHEEPKKGFLYRKNSKTLERSSSDRRPLSDCHLDTKLSATSLARNRLSSFGSDHLGDSGLLGDCGVALVDVASQTDENVESHYIHKSYSLVTNATQCPQLQS